MNTIAVMAALALLVRIGHVLHTMGSVRARSAAAVAVRAAIGTACIVLSVFLVARLFEWFGHAPLADSPTRGMVGESDVPAARRPVKGLGVFFASPISFLTVLSFALMPMSLLEAATAERARTRGAVVAALVLTLIALPLLTSLGWAAIAQFDHPRGDGSYGGSVSMSAVGRVWPIVLAHLVAGAGALAVARTIGARSGKYNRDGSANVIPAHSVPMVVGGDLLLVLGLPMMVAALAGDPASRVLNGLLAGSSATLLAGLIVYRRERRLDVAALWSALVAGLVAGSVSGPSSPMIAVVLGAILGLVLPPMSRKLDLKARLDDPSGLALAHLLGALAGLTGAAIDGTLEGKSSNGDALLLASIALCGGVGFALISAAIAAVPAIMLKQIGWLRVEEDFETEGLDLSQHDVNAYPDFQQTLIKSYHLRQ